MVDKLKNMCYHIAVHNVDEGRIAMDNIITLRGVVMSKYKTSGECAQAIGWKRNKASRIVNGIQDPDITDMELLARTLDIKTQEDFIRIFFAPLSTLWTPENV